MAKCRSSNSFMLLYKRVEVRCVKVRISFADNSRSCIFSYDRLKSGCSYKFTQILIGIVAREGKKKSREKAEKSRRSLELLWEKNAGSKFKQLVKRIKG